MCSKAYNCGAASKVINGFEVVLIEAGVVSGLFLLYRTQSTVHGPQSTVHSPKAKVQGPKFRGGCTRSNIEPGGGAPAVKAVYTTALAGVNNDLTFLAKTAGVAGNGITEDVPLENLRAFYDETYRYGVEHRRQWG